MGAKPATAAFERNVVELPYQDSAATLLGAVRGEHIDIGGSLVHFTEVGNGPPLVFQQPFGPLPGTTAWLAWGEVVERLKGSYRCILIDFPNFGRSEPREFHEPVHDLLVRNTVGVMDRLGLERADMVGLSMGGTVTIDLAIAHPERVGRMLIGGSHASTGGDPYVLAPFPSEVHRLFVECQGAEGSRSDIKRLLHALVYDPMSISDDLVDAMHGWRVSEAIHADSWRLSESVAHSNLAQLSSITRDVLLVHGRHDRMVPLEQSLLLMGYLPQAHLVVLNECGHWPSYERPSAVADVIARFFR